MGTQFRTLLKIAGVMAAVLVAVKVAGLHTAPPDRILPTRVGIVPFETDQTQRAEAFAREIGGVTAARLGTVDGITPVLIATRPAGFGTPAVNRQIRFNYQVGTLLTGRVSASGNRTSVTTTMIDTARDRIIWQRTLQSEDTLGAILAKVSEEIASAIVAEL